MLPSRRVVDLHPCDYVIPTADGYDRMKRRVSPSLLTAVSLQVLLLWLDGAHAVTDAVSSTRSCERDGECNVQRGEVCRWLYDGCTRGQCMCPTGRHLDTDRDRCTSRKLGLEMCDEVEDQCYKTMHCISGMCKCVYGRMTPDHTFCLGRYQVLLGDKCSQNSHCFHKSPSGYTNKFGVECNAGGFCVCQRGYKQEDSRCRKLNIGERGCTANDHCSGGALCESMTCKCPPRYTPTSYYTKCAKPGARVDLSVGDTCDEINETGYCAHGLICHNCAGDIPFKCVKCNTTICTSHSRIPSFHGLQCFIWP